MYWAAGSRFEAFGQPRAVALAFVARLLGQINGKRPRKHNELRPRRERLDAALAAANGTVAEKLWSTKTSLAQHALWTKIRFWQMLGICQKKTLRSGASSSFRIVAIRRCAFRGNLSCLGR